MSAELSSGPAGAMQAVRVQVLFHTTDEHQAQTVAAKLIDRAHEIANLPECECDVDVSVESASLEKSQLEGASAVDSFGGAPPRERPSKS